jgi:hypothetical protein
MSALTPLGTPPFDYDGAVYDPALWAEVGMLPPVEPYVRAFENYTGEQVYSCGAQVWVYYADQDRWHLDSTTTGAKGLVEAGRRARWAIPEMEAHRAAVLQANATVVDA